MFGRIVRRALAALRRGAYDLSMAAFILRSRRKDAADKPLILIVLAELPELALRKARAAVPQNARFEAAHALPAEVEGLFLGKEGDVFAVVSSARDAPLVRTDWQSGTPLRRDRYSKAHRGVRTSCRRRPGLTCPTPARSVAARAGSAKTIPTGHGRQAASAAPASLAASTAPAPDFVPHDDYIKTWHVLAAGMHVRPHSLWGGVQCGPHGVMWQRLGGTNFPVASWHLPALSRWNGPCGSAPAAVANARAAMAMMMLRMCWFLPPSLFAKGRRRTSRSRPSHRNAPLICSWPRRAAARSTASNSGAKSPRGDVVSAKPASATAISAAASGRVSDRAPPDRFSAVSACSAVTVRKCGPWLPRSPADLGDRRQSRRLVALQARADPVFSAFDFGHDYSLTREGPEPQKSGSEEKPRHSRARS